jgi:hypothetical protein
VWVVVEHAALNAVVAVSTLEKKVVAKAEVLEGILILMYEAPVVLFACTAVCLYGCLPVLLFACCAVCWEARVRPSSKHCLVAVLG